MHFPHDLKLAEVSPIHKKGDIQKIQNYQPVSILTSMSKVYEEILMEQMKPYFEKIFNENLSAFRKKVSTHYVLINLIEKLEKIFG